MVLAGALLPVTVACSGSHPAPSSSTVSPASSRQPGGSSAAVPSAVPSAGAAGAVKVRYALGGYQPLWPFADEAEALAWQEGYQSGGHAPWHLDADQTALAFVRFLGFGGIDRVTSRRVTAEDAHIGVGYRSTETGESGTAAVLHLIKIGPAKDAPWEVVGTDDTDLSLTTPAYGATASSPLPVGGRITGVDESIRVAIRQRSAEGVLGRFCCVAAGGTGGAWSARVPFQGATDPVLIVVASTGGHLADVERFAVTGFHPAR
ncbi:MAG: hypothetical protein QOE54_373 [Streptosporangiaceae bacterium]|jgi:hypothetical protein|nr:putative Tat (twin-arginine translocation) pathway signal sequence [Streptosporangiaceae bacterium]MDX6428007.1 hypothetical protein [Streptosporangiaceae bacterium]